MPEARCRLSSGRARDAAVLGPLPIASRTTRISQTTCASDRRRLAVALPAGVAGMYGVGRLLQSVIVKTNGGDSGLIVAIALVMIVVSLAACVWAARRAMRLDPVTALRQN